MQALKRNKPWVALALGVIFVFVLGASSCGGDDDSGNAQGNESKTQQDSYQRLAAAQPAVGMDYSPTRETIKTWIKTWGVRGQLAFTYIVNQNGDKTGYYVFEGPPVSSCVALTPTYRFVDPRDGVEGSFQVPAPSVDGAYYSGGQCLSYYGKDANTGQLIEFSIGGAQNYILATQPIYRDVAPLGVTKIEDVKPNAQGEYIKN